MEVTWTETGFEEALSRISSGWVLTFDLEKARGSCRLEMLERSVYLPLDLLNHPAELEEMVRMRLCDALSV